MNTMETIKTRRSIRKFKSDKISHELLEEVIEAAALAPSWKNTQITRFVAIESEVIKNKVATEFSPIYNQQAILTAPTLLALSVVKNRSGFERDGSFSTTKGSGWEMFDCGIATQTLCLAAQELGLGTVIMGIFDYEKVSNLLEIPSEQELIALVAIGYSDETPAAPKRKTVEDLLSYK